MTPSETDASASPESPGIGQGVVQPHRRRWIVTAALALVLLIGAGAGYVAITREDPQKHRHFITVMLDSDITAAQRTAVEEELRKWNPTVGPEFRGSSTIASMAAEMYQDDPETLERATDMALPAMIVMIVESPAFDCDPVPVVRGLPGVQSIEIEGVAKSGGRFGPVACP